MTRQLPVVIDRSGPLLVTPVSDPGEPPANTEASTEGSIWRYLGFALGAALLLLVIGLGLALVVIPKVTGATPLTVLTSSMEPGLPPGTLIVVRPVGPDALRIGDVVTSQMESGNARVVTHRILSIVSSSDGSRSFIVQGDNNSVPDDEPVVAEQIQGRLWYAVPYVGYANNLINGANRAWIIPVVTVGLFGYAGFMATASVVESTRKRKRAADAGQPADAAALAAADG